MKKLVAIATVATLCVAGSMTAFGADINAEEQKVLDMVKAGADINGVHLDIPASYYNQLENFFLSDDVSLTAADYTEAQAVFNETVEKAVAADVTAFNALPTADIDAITSRISTYAKENLDLEVSYDVAKGFVVTDKEGNVVIATGSNLNNTGMESGNMMLAGAAMVLAMAGAAAYVAKKKESLV